MTLLEAFKNGLDIKPVDRCSKSSFQFDNKNKQPSQCVKIIPSGINDMSMCDSNKPFERFMDEARAHGLRGLPEIDCDLDDMHKDTPIRSAEQSKTNER